MNQITTVDPEVANDYRYWAPLAEVLGGQLYAVAGRDACKIMLDGVVYYFDTTLRDCILNALRKSEVTYH